MGAAAAPADEVEGGVEDGDAGLAEEGGEDGLDDGPVGGEGDRAVGPDDGQRDRAEGADGRARVEVVELDAAAVHGDPQAGARTPGDADPEAVEDEAREREVEGQRVGAAGLDEEAPGGGGPEARRTGREVGAEELDVGRADGGEVVEHRGLDAGSEAEDEHRAVAPEPEPDAVGDVEAPGLHRGAEAGCGCRRRAGEEAAQGADELGHRVRVGDDGLVVAAQGTERVGEDVGGGQGRDRAGGVDAEECLEQVADVAEPVEGSAERVTDDVVRGVEGGLGRGEVEQVVVATTREVDVVDGEGEARPLVLVEGDPDAEAADAGRAGEQVGAAGRERPEGRLGPHRGDGRDGPGARVGAQQVDHRPDVGAGRGGPGELDPGHEDGRAGRPGTHVEPEQQPGRPDGELDGVACRPGRAADEPGELTEPGVEGVVVTDDRRQPVDQGAQAALGQVGEREGGQVGDVGEAEDAGQPGDVPQGVVGEVERGELLAQQADDELEDLGAELVG